MCQKGLYFKKQLELEPTADKLIVQLCPQSQKAQFLTKVRTSGLANDDEVHKLYSIISLVKQNKLYKCINDSLMNLRLHQFMNDKFSHGGRGLRLSDLLMTQIIELIALSLKYYVKEMQSENEKGKNLAFIYQILGNIHEIYTKSFNSKMSKSTKQLMLRCIDTINSIDHNRINNQYYLDLLIELPEIMDPFVFYFEQYTEINQDQDLRTVEKLIKGLCERLKYLKTDTIMDKRTILRLLEAFVDYISKLRKNSPCLNFIFQHEYQVIKEKLYSLITKKYNPNTIAGIVDKLIATYLVADMSNYKRYEFVLELIKFVIHKASVIFGMMKCTDELQVDLGFMEWFFLKELDINNQIELVQVYTSNKFALEFLLLMMIYIISNFPDKANYLASLMRAINLLQEAKYFMNSQDTRDCMKIFFKAVTEEEDFEEWENFMTEAQMYKSL